MQVKSFSASPQELMVTLSDSALFLCGGERSPSLLLPPSKDATLTWKLIPSQVRAGCGCGCGCWVHRRRVPS